MVVSVRVHPDQQAVVAANEAFYQAMSQRDSGEMARLWFPAEWVECVHPGGSAVRGWDAVRESFERLFASRGAMLIAATETRVRLIGDVAWVSCVERITLTVDDQMASSAAQATNVFVRHDAEWRLVLHHASPVPLVAPPLPEGGIRVN